MRPGGKIRRKIGNVKETIGQDSKKRLCKGEIGCFERVLRF